MSRNAVAQSPGTLAQPPRLRDQRASRRTRHLMPRRGRWYWRRRPPAGRRGRCGTDPTGAGLAICLSLFTGDRTTARVRAAFLDAGSERATMPPPSAAAAAGPAVTLRDAMARLRDHLIAEHERTRAARPADPPRAAPRSEAVAFPPDLVEDLVAFAEQGGAMQDDELPEGLTARACEALAGGPKRVRRQSLLERPASARHRRAEARARRSA